MSELKEQQKKKIKIVAIMGEAGSGKDSLLLRLIEKKGWNNIISCTTRPARNNEIPNLNYYFLTEEEFKEREKNNEMLETTYFNGWYYGTPLFVLNENAINVGVFNPAGIIKLLENEDIDVRVYRLKTSKTSRIIRQFKRENKPSKKEIARRFFADNKDFKNLPFKYTTLENETCLDLDYNTSYIWAEND